MHWKKYFNIVGRESRRDYDLFLRALKEIFQGLYQALSTWQPGVANIGEKKADSNIHIPKNQKRRTLIFQNESHIYKPGGQHDIPISMA